MRTLAVSALLFLSCLPSGTAGADEPVRRHVLALIEGTKPDEYNEDLVHTLLELPLNHLGMVVRRHYIGNGPPPAAWLEDTRAVLTYFSGADKPVAWLWPWLRKLSVRVIHFGDFGPLAGPELAAWLERFGLRYDDQYRAGPLGVDVTFRNARDCMTEADPRAFAIHRGPASLPGRNRVWVTTRVGDDVRTPVVTGPWGGIALDPWTLRMGGDDQERRWHIDPFRFFREALGLELVPAPHPSVLNGRRMLFVHVDGDGFESLSTIRPGIVSARVMTDEVFRRHKLPFTVSIIVRSLTPDYAIKKPTEKMRLAREILNLPNVEPASHGVLHTLDWQRDLKPDSGPRSIMWYLRLQNYTYSPLAEVRDSIRFINERLMEPGRRCELMLWTGAANPLEDPIQASVDAGCMNLNGGVFRWDELSDSVGFVSPWSRRVGKRLQVYAGAANENDFQGFFDTMPGAFAHIDTTIERTGSPRILKPADIYIHFYSAEHRARLNALQKLIRRWGFDEPTTPVFASTYARAVHSAVETAKIVRREGGWGLRDFGDCRTVRIDKETRAIDWRKSRGLLGARRIGESLYVHLAKPDADIVFGHGKLPHVLEANCLLEDVVRKDHSLAMTATAHNRRIVRFAGFASGGAVTARIGDETKDLQADARGELTLTLPEPGSTRIEVR